MYNDVSGTLHTTIPQAGGVSLSISMPMPETWLVQITESASGNELAVFDQVQSVRAMCLTAGDGRGFRPSRQMLLRISIPRFFVVTWPETVNISSFIYSLPHRLSRL